MLYVPEDASLWAQWIHSFHMHLIYLGPILFPYSLCFLHSPSSSAITVVVAASAGSQFGSHLASLVVQMVKNPPAMQDTWVQSLGWEDSLEEGMATHSSFLPGEPHGERSLAGDSPRGRKESDTTEWLSTAQYIHIWRPETPDSCDVSCLLIWQEIFSFHKA